MTPSFRHGSLPESEKSPLHFKMGNLDSHLKHGSARADSRFSWRHVLTTIMAILFLAGAVMAYMSSKSAQGLAHRSPLCSSTHVAKMTVSHSAVIKAHPVRQCKRNVILPQSRYHPCRTVYTHHYPLCCLEGPVDPSCIDLTRFLI